MPQKRKVNGLGQGWEGGDGENGEEVEEGGEGGSGREVWTSEKTGRLDRQG